MSYLVNDFGKPMGVLKPFLFYAHFNACHFLELRRRMEKRVTQIDTITLLPFEPFFSIMDMSQCMNVCVFVISYFTLYTK